MRVLFCKIHFSFICFCKPSSQLFNLAPLKLKNTPHAAPQPPRPPEVNSLEEGKAFEVQSRSNTDGICNVDANHPPENGLKSCLRKTLHGSSFVEKKKVQWVDDVFGKQLAEIKEFETSEDGDNDYERVNNRRCVCTIL